MVKTFVYGPWGRLPLHVEDFADLSNQILTKLQIEHFEIYKDAERSIPLTEKEEMSNGMRLYIVSDPIKKTDVKANLCNHPKDKRCFNCAVEEILDTDDKKDKYLSYKDYVALLDQKGKTPPSYDYAAQICKGHPVNVTCMKCLEKAITLMPQIHRHTDYVEFDTSFYVTNFINEWRTTQKQQLGVLLGKRKEVDGKQRAVVSAIWTPPQSKYPDGIHLDKIEEFPFKGLDVLGIIYTDLFHKNNTQYSYKIENGIILSAFELEFYYKIAKELNSMYNLNMNELVFVCTSADAEKQIGLSVYMPTSQFYAVMGAELLGLSTEPTSFVNESKREILYMYRNEYNLDVSTKADPYVPIEYFFVTCEAGYSKTSLFPNTEVEQHLTTVKKLASYFDGDYHDFHKYKNLYVLLCLNNSFKGTQKIFDAILSNNQDAFEAVLNSDEFLKMIMQLEKHKQVKWTCNACTFLNDGLLTQCEMCGTPKGG